jgi:hypothetical protein
MCAAILVSRSDVAAQTPKAELPAAKEKTLLAEDDKAIRKTIAGIEEAWNAHDMKAYSKLLMDDIEWVNVVGMHWRGRDAVMCTHPVE